MLVSLYESLNRINKLSGSRTNLFESLTIAEAIVLIIIVMAQVKELKKSLCQGSVNETWLDKIKGEHRLYASVSLRLQSISHQKSNNDVVTSIVETADGSIVEATFQEIIYLAKSLVGTFDTICY